MLELAQDEEEEDQVFQPIWSDFLLLKVRST